MTERQMQLEDWLDDLCVRFIINLPEDNLSSVERICFQVEEAQWFYEDFIRPLDPNLPTLSLRSFCLRIFTHCPLLSAFAIDGRHMQAFEEFLTYKKRIPVRGAIMLNEAMDAAVLVKGWKKGANWSFPRGKINKDEDDLICAIREVYEETGYDLEAAGLVPVDRQVKYIEVNMREQQMRLYVFKNVPMDTYFEPRTRKEISKIQWWRLSELPAFKKKNQQDQPDTATNANKFYMVAPFLVPLRKWVLDQKKKDKAHGNRVRPTSMAPEELLTEEDRGEESATHVPSYTSAPEPNSLEEATEALSRLLKIQPPTQGLQSDATASVSAVTSSGQALLALLQSRPSGQDVLPVSSRPPQSPMDHRTAPISMPEPPHHIQPRQPNLSAMPQPPTFAVQSSRDTVSYHDSISQAYRHVDPALVHRQILQHPQPLGLHPHQSQHLIHPQPLPPQVQKALFTAAPLQSPTAPNATAHHHLPAASITSSTPSRTHFPSHHMATMPEVPIPSPSKLSSHSLALLNAFKSRDQADSRDANPANNLSPAYVHGLTQATTARPQPQELPAELSQDNPPASRNIQLSLTSSNNPSPIVARQPISAAQRSTLLDMFKSPTAQPVVPAQLPNATALPTGNTPSAVELSAVEPLSSTAAPTASLPLVQMMELDAQKGLIPKLNPEANLPFRATSILARPTEPSSKDCQAKLHAPTIHRQPKRTTPLSSTITVETQKRFQPEILRRPQPVTPCEVGSNVASAISSVSAQPQRTAQPQLTQQKQPAIPSTDHRQSLLSLFSGSSQAIGPAPTAPITKDILGTESMSARSRVGSLTSGNVVSHRGSQTPISPADKGFLLNYLDAVANGTQR